MYIMCVFSKTTLYSCKDKMNLYNILDECHKNSIGAKDSGQTF